MALAHTNLGVVYGKLGDYEKAKKILQKALEVAKTDSILTIDITGGSPEMNPHFEWFISQASKLRKKIIARTNLVILKEKKYHRFLDVYAKYGVELYGSLPNYFGDQSDRQRGYGSFRDAIEVIRKLNDKEIIELARLARKIGEDKARKIYKQLLDFNIKIHSRASYDFIVYVQGDIDYFSTVDTKRQMGADLGEKMMTAFKEQLKYYNSVAIVGSDLILEKHHVEQAFSELWNRFQ